MNLRQIFSIILTIFAASKALICYECRYCDDIFQSPRITEDDCSQYAEITTCEKVVYELLNTTRGVIARRCQYQVLLSNASFSGSYSSGKQISPTDHIQEYFAQIAVRQNITKSQVSRVSAYYCQTNYCNGTSTTYGSSLTIAILILTFLLL